jgi:hypothetical protein
MGSKLMAFNYRSIFLDEADRLDLHQRRDPTVLGAKPKKPHDILSIHELNSASRAEIWRSPLGSSDVPLARA